MTKSKMNPKVDAYLRKANTRPEEMKQLRTILLASPLTEELKWRKPCYTFGTSNVVVIQGFKDYCALLFFKGVLLKDPHGILTKTGENTRVGRQIRFTNVQEIAKLAPVLRTYILNAIAVEKAGLKVDLPPPRVPVPKELQNKFAQDPAFKTAFNALTPGRQRGYLIHFSAAKQSKTRESRIEKYTPQILKGKGLHDR